MSQVVQENAKNDLQEKLKALEETTYTDEDSVEFPPADIVAYNELRSCADIVRMYKNEQLIIQPEFQRDIVWTESGQTRFIDSLIKQLPIPSMCISLDYKTQKRIVIDGLQRISSIIKFLTEDEWKLSKLSDIDQKISGKTVTEIKAKNLELYERVENLTIPITVIRYDASKSNHNNYLFTIFHRLNTGGTKLNNQEIRNCIYYGSFNNFLKECVKYPKWRELLGLEANYSYRFEYEELILRFFAFYENYQNYKGRLAKFLNEYMDIKRNVKDSNLKEKMQLFQRTVNLIFEKISDKKPLDKISKVMIEGLLVGIAKNIDKLEKLPSEDLKKKYQSLRDSPPYSTQNLIGGILRKDKVITRVETSINIFSKLDD